MIILERNYSVNVFNTDHTGRLSAGMLFNLFQDIAGRHASVLGFGREHLMTNGFFWVLSRMRVEIERMPLTYEEVTIRTWPRGTESIFAIRDIEMYDQSGKRVAAASSSWVIVDFDTRKVQRPDKALSHLNSKFPETRALPVNASKVPNLPSEDHIIKDYTVVPGDIDENLHVNNARYIQWVTNCYPMSFLSENIPRIIEVNYLSEGHDGESIKIITGDSQEPEGKYLHSIIRPEDNTELCRISINWRKVKE